MKFDWDPEFDTPATIAIIGDGAAAVEAALYARFLGYFVILYCEGRVGDSLALWGDRMMDREQTPQTSSLGLAALEAQGGACQLSSAEATYRSYVEDYLIPVAKTDLLYESVQINTKVVSISRVGVTAGMPQEPELREELEFRVLAESQARGEYTQLVDLVLDCRTVQDAVCGLAPGGGLARGQRQVQSSIRRGKQDVAGKRKDDYSGKRCLLLGGGVEAAANAIELSQLIKLADEGKLTWVEPAADVAGPSSQDLQGNQILEQAHTLNASSGAQLVRMKALGIESLQYQEDGGWRAVIQAGLDETVAVEADVLVDCWPSIDSIRPIYAEPTVVQIAGKMESGLIVTAEPHYYRLGHGDEGGLPRPPSHYQRQIRDAFALIGGRPELDLYATVQPSG